jgi:uncharacterized protein
MTAAFFGDARHPLFGSLTMPVGSDLEHAVLLMAPIGHESVRTHWALRTLATALSRAGFTVFRFDWYGLGDSAGTFKDVTLSRMKSDAESAATELRDMTGLRKLSVVGLRLGATLAALTAKKVRARALVLWEPVWSGVDYLARLKRLHAATLADEKRYYAPLTPLVRGVMGKVFPGARRDRRSARDEYVGFVFSEKLQNEVAHLDRETLLDVPRVPVFLAYEGLSPTGALAAFAAKGISVEALRCGNPGAWDDPRRVEDLWLPGDAPRVIAEALAEVSR